MQTTSKQIPVLTVAQLTRSIKRQLEENFRVVWIQGEVSNAKLHSSGHFYFSLKDQEAQISGVMFRGAVQRNKFVPKDGDKVVVRGEITVYPPQGRYQVMVHEIKPAGIGELLQKLEELKKELKARGWFDADKKKPIPKLPKRIGIVTSPTGAAIRDILNVIHRRFAGVHVIINPVKVQGEGAAAEIAQAIRQFNDHALVDVMIVGRGGGSIEDLWAFNELEVAKAIHESRIPVISAVGHETDTTIADFVADLRAPTPSAAAELAIGEKEQQLQYLRQVDSRLRQGIMHRLQVASHRLNALAAQPIFTSPYGILGPLMQKLDSYQKRVQALKPTNQIKNLRQNLVAYSRQLVYAWKSGQSRRLQQLNAESKRKRIHQLLVRNFQQKGADFKKLITALQALDPKQVLKKGYAIPFSEKEGSVVTSTLDVKENDALRLLISDGEIFTTVTGIKPK